MSTSVTWNGTTYSIPASGEGNWPALSNFLIALGQKAAAAEEMKQAIRVATTTPVSVSATTDCCVVTNMGVASAVAVTLPAGATGQIFVITDGKGDAGTNTITITPNGAETINGAATYALNINNQSVILGYVGGDWKVLGLAKENTFTQASDASLGSELITTTADRDMSSDTGHWTGSNWSIGGGKLTHTAGATAATLAGYAATASANYQIVLTVNTTTVGTLTISYGGSTFAVIGRQTGSQTWTLSSSAASTAGLVLTPDSNWEGTIDDVSIKLITDAKAALEIGNNTDSTDSSVRSPVSSSIGIGTSSLVEAQSTAVNNSCFGYKAGRFLLTGTDNVLVGKNSGYYTTTGTYNVFLGCNAGQNNTVGVRNVAIGHNAKDQGYRGDGCVHIGYYSGRYNIASYNVSVGYNSLATNTVGAGCTAVGYNTLAASTGDNNTAVGSSAGGLITSGGSNVAVGAGCLGHNLTGSSNTALGTSCLHNTTGGENTAIGTSAGDTNTSGEKNTFLGRHAGYTNSTGSNNIAVGCYAGKYNTASFKLYIDAFDRTNTAGDEAGAILVGNMSATASAQTLKANATFTATKFYVSSLNTAPANAGDTGTAGEVRICADAIYVCTATNTWKKTAIATW